MACKIVLFYNQNQRGWTETYYSQDADPKAMLQAVPAATWSKFIKFRSKLTQLVAARATITGGARNSWLLPLYNFVGGGFGISTSDNLPDVVSTDVLYRVTGQVNKTRRLAIRGLFDADLFRTLEGQDQISAQLRSNINAMFTAMTNLAWQIRYQGAPGINAIVLKIEASPIGLGFSDVTVSGVIANQLGNEMFGTGVPRDDVPGFPRQFVVAAQSLVGGNSVLTIPYRYRENGPTVPARMRLKSVNWQYTFINEWIFERLSERKTGRPFGSLRGRSRAAVRAQ